jgi:uncharacterized membrane protein required for colicin V production
MYTESIVHLPDVARSFTWLDGALLFVILGSGLFGWLKGMVRSIGGTLGWIIALGFAFWILPWGYAYMCRFLPEALWTFILVAGVLFLLFFVLVLFISEYLAYLISATFLRPIDRFLGCVFGLFRGGFLICGVMWLLLNFAPLHRQSSVVKHAWIIPWTDRVVIYSEERAKVWFLNPTFRDFVQKRVELCWKVGGSDLGAGLKAHADGEVAYVLGQTLPKESEPELGTSASSGPSFEQDFSLKTKPESLPSKQPPSQELYQGEAE